MPDFSVHLVHTDQLFVVVVVVSVRCMFDVLILLRYLTLRTGPVVVWVETTPLRQKARICD